VDASAVLTVMDIEGVTERFPALLFLPKKDGSSDPRLEDVATFYING
jgi:hypothetical protein